MNFARSVVLVALVMASPTLADPPPKDCNLRIRASLDLDMDETGRVTVPVTFNSVPHRMMVDTGATESLVTARVAKALGLTPHKASGHAYMAGFGGIISDQVVDITEFGFGRMKGKDFSFFIEPGYMESAGLLGYDFLGNFDLDFDFAHARLDLISPDRCPGLAVYWTKQAFGEVPFEIDGGHILVKVTLDGKEIQAILDTGAADTVMSLERVAYVYDVNEDEIAKTRRYPFKTLAFGGVSVLNPAITLVRDKESQAMGARRSDLHMIIGMTVLRGLHLYVSYKEKMIYVTPATQY